MTRGVVPAPLRLDFVAPSPERRAARAALALGLLALAAAAAHALPAWQRWQHERQALAALPAAPVPRAAPPSRSEAAALRAAVQVQRELIAPWADLLRALESSASKDVALVAVEPAAERQTVKITAEARQLDAMLDFLVTLGSRGLADVHLQSHQTQQQQPGAPIRFVVQARWAGGAR